MKENRRIGREGSKSSLSFDSRRDQILLFTKLFVIMGITWIGECLHVFVHGDHHDWEQCSFYTEVEFTLPAISITEIKWKI